jgi:hypothetical protein
MPAEKLPVPLQVLSSRDDLNGVQRDFPLVLLVHRLSQDGNRAFEVDRYRSCSTRDYIAFGQHEDQEDGWFSGSTNVATTFYIVDNRGGPLRKR